MSQTLWASSSPFMRARSTDHNVAAEILQAFVARNSTTRRSQSYHRRYYAGQAAATVPDQGSNETRNGQTGFLGERAKQRQAAKEFFADLLSSAATKRDAKAYISRLKAPSKPPVKSKSPSQEPPARSQVNVGNLFGRSRAVEASPVFTQYNASQEQTLEEQETVHVALVKLSDLSHMSDVILEGVAQTLSQLSRLSMAPCVVLEGPSRHDMHKWRNSISEQVDRLVAAIDAVSGNGARRMDNLFNLPSDGRPRVFLRKLLMRPLRRNQIPVIVPIAYSEESQMALDISADEAMLALTKEFAGLNLAPGPDDDPHLTAEQYKAMQDQVSLDRIIVIDESGAIPSTKSLDRKHVFVNLEQEYASLQEELRSSSESRVSQKHASNLRMLRYALRLLPASASGLITSPLDAANPSRIEQSQTAPNVGTRRQKNALIHNLLTDKPAYSSSLPSGRRARNPETPVYQPTSTFVKRGMPLTILPEPAAQPWSAHSRPRLELTDPRIDLSRLVYLINDSFSRKLDVEAYLRRVNDRIAGVIIAGEYEGGALLTWETPPGVDDNDVSRQVPYLDKFAVLKRSQGAGGVADIVFNAMVRTCFPNGVCWRSRKDNPVNKWYFERSRGTWKIPDMNWTMFWTTPGVAEGNGTFRDYEAVCRGVQPTWADNQKVQD